MKAGAPVPRDLLPFRDSHGLHLTGNAAIKSPPPYIPGNEGQQLAWFGDLDLLYELSAGGFNTVRWGYGQNLQETAARFGIADDAQLMPALMLEKVREDADGVAPVDPADVSTPTERAHQSYLQGHNLVSGEGGVHGKGGSTL